MVGTKKRWMTALLVLVLAVCLSALCWFVLPTKNINAADGSGAETTTEQPVAGESQSAEALQQAIDAAADGETVQVQMTSDVTGNITIADGKNIVLDLNGYTLTGEGDHGIINNGTLVITDSVGGGKVVVTADSKAALLNYGDATLLGGEFTRETAGTGGWYVIKNYGSLVIGEENKECGVVVDSNGGDESSLLVSGYYDADDKAANKGLITSANPLKVVINGGTFNGGLNTIKNDSESVMIINGGTFTNGKNYTVQNCNEMTVNGGTFVQTASKDVNGLKAVYALYSDDNTKLTITAGDFTAVTYAVYLKDNVNAVISGGTFDGETALYAGGKVTLTISGGAFTGTEKYGISIDENAVVDISGEETVISGSEYGLRVRSAYGNINISDATISGETAVYMNRPTSYAITSGVFNGAINVTNNTAGISGGTFDSIPNYKYFTDGNVWTDNGDGTYGVEASENGFAAAIGNIGYTSLESAVAAAENGATVTLLADVTQAVTIAADKNVIIDMSGFNINVSGEAAIVNNGTLVLENSGEQGVVSCDNTQGAINNFGTMTLNGVTVNGTENTGVRNEESGVMTVIDSAISAPEYALRNMGVIETIKNCDITATNSGRTGLYNAGYIKEVVGGTITANGSTLFPGTAINSSHSEGTDNKGTIGSIENVTINGEIALSYAANITITDGVYDGLVINANGPSSVAIVGGTFTGLEIETEEETSVAVSGGTFDSLIPAEYLAADVALDVVDGGFAVIAAEAAATAVIDGVSYVFADINDALAQGDTVKLLADVNASIVIAEGRDITIDLNGFTLTGEGDHTIVNNGTLTVIDSSEAKSGAVDNVTHAKGALVNNGTAILNGGTFKRSAEAGVSATDNGGNSWYVIENHGKLTINDGVAVYHGTSAEMAAQWKHSSLIRNVGTSADATATLTVNGGEFYTGRIALKNDDYGTLTVNGGQISSGNQAVQNWYKATVDGGTFDGMVITWFYSDNTGAADMTINDGIFNAQVKSVDFEAGADGVYPLVSDGTTISGGKFAVMPNEAYFADGLTGELYDGYYVVIEAVTEDNVALIEAQLAAQADARNYLAALGLTLADLETSTESGAADIVALYDAIADATSVSRVQLAKLRLMDAADEFVAALAAELDAYKAEKIAALETLAGDGYVPAYAIAAINGAASVAEVDACYNAAVAEINAADDGEITPPTPSDNGDGVSLTGVYVMLGVILVVAVAALMILLLKKQKQAEAAEAKAAAPLDRQLAEVKQAVEADETAAAVSAAAEDDDKEQIVIEANVRTFDEAYDELDEEQKKLFNDVKDYALTKEGAALTELSSGVCVKKGSKQIVKLTVRRGNPVALFVIENEMIKDFRRNSDAPVKLKVKATELVLRSGGDLEAAKAMVDVAVDQIEKDILAAKERRREARRLRRQRKREQKRQ